MPEGDTVFKLAAVLEDRLAGRRLTQGKAGSPAVDLSGRRVLAVEAVGKHLLISLDDGRVVRSHLGMRGSWHWYPPGAAWLRSAGQARIVLDTGEAVFVCFSPKEVEILSAGGVRRRVLEARLGPDLLGGELPLVVIVARAREIAPPDAPVTDVLLDQRIACGIGNVFKSEVLFLERTAPAARVSGLSDDRLAALYRTAARLLRHNTGGGPRVTRPGGKGPGRLWVYRRRGQPCFRCGGPVRCARMGRDHRSTYWCPRCQK
jgi:endonuclease-8